MKTLLISSKPGLCHTHFQYLISQRLLLLMMLVLWGSYGMKAQVLSGGIKAGANYSDFSHFEVDKSVILYHVGGFLNLALTDKFGIQGEGLLSRQGYNREQDMEFRERTMYINVPLLLNYRISPGIRILAGGRAGFLMSADKLFGEEEDGIDNVDIKDDYESIEYGAVLGAELGITDQISIGATANIGFGSYRNQPKESRQRLYQLSIAYRLFKI